MNATDIIVKWSNKSTDRNVTTCTGCDTDHDRRSCPVKDVKPVLRKL